MAREGQEFPADNSEPVPFIPSCCGGDKSTRTELFPAPFPWDTGDTRNLFFPKIFSPHGFPRPAAGVCPAPGVARWDFGSSEDHPGSVPSPNRRGFGFVCWRLEFRPWSCKTSKFWGEEGWEGKGKALPSSDISPCSSHESHPLGSDKSQIIAGPKRRESRSSPKCGMGFPWREHPGRIPAVPGALTPSPRVPPAHPCPKSTWKTPWRIFKIQGFYPAGSGRGPISANGKAISFPLDFKCQLVMKF